MADVVMALEVYTEVWSVRSQLMQSGLEGMVCTVMADVGMALEVWSVQLWPMQLMALKLWSMQVSPMYLLPPLYGLCSCELCNCFLESMADGGMACVFMAYLRMALWFWPM